MQQLQQQPPSAPTAMTGQQQQRQHPPAATTTPPRRKVRSLEDTVLLPTVPDEETPDGRIRNVQAVQHIRDAWIYTQVRKRQAEFTQFRSARCFVGTWNVNAKGKPEDSLAEWLRIGDWQQRPQTAPDIIVVGFQEIVDLNAVNVGFDGKTQQRASFWTDRLRSTIAQSNIAYELIAHKSMVGLHIVCFAQPHHRVAHVQTSAVGVGVLGIAGNKGGVSIRLHLYDSTLAFCCTHLAAHRENVVGRNQDVANILQKSTFDIGEAAVREVVRSGSYWTQAPVVKLMDHDVVVWLGDLNYRIDESMPTELVLQHAERGHLEPLRVLDQLNLEREAGRTLDVFEEGPLLFPPTYKYQPGTDVYEQRPDKKLRAPAWCDRILWSSPDAVTQLSYGRSETPNCSDHKPVYSMLQLTIKDVIPEKREAVYDELMKVLDRYENQTLPVVGLDRVSLDFGELKYQQTVTLPIKITNTGSVVAQYRLVPKPDENNVCKPWLTVSPKFGMLIPGEQPATINFTLTVSKETARLLNSGREVLDDILILRLENGRDYYITIKATFARSCFGMTVDELVMYSQPIRSVPIDPVDRPPPEAASAPTALCVPKELWRVVDAIYEKGLHAPHLFVEPGVPGEVALIRECLDTGASFGTTCRVHSYSEVLVSFLSSLAAPIVPLAMFPSTEIDSQNIQMTARRVLEELAPIHYNVFVYVISFLREVLVQRQQNLVTPAKLARICSTCLCETEDVPEAKRTGMQLVFLHLLETTSI